MQRAITIWFGDRALREQGLAGYVPHVPYVVFPFEFEAIRRVEIQSGRSLIAAYHDRTPTVRYWRGEDLNDKTVAFHNAGQLGDELVATASIYALRYRYPRMTLVVYGRGDNAYVTQGSPDTQTVTRMLPVAIDAAQFDAYDYWIAPAAVGMHHRGEATNIYDLVAHEVGIAPHLRRPRVYLTGADRAATRDVLSRRATLTGQPLGPNIAAIFKNLVVVQVNASQPNRTPPVDWFALLSGLRRRIGAHYWFVALGDAEPTIAAVYRADTGEVIPTAIPCPREGVALSPRSIMALVESAQLVIAPDSFLVHCAAAFDVPCIALWNDATETTPEPITEEIDIAIRTRAANPYFTHSAVPGERPSDRIPPPESRVSTYDNVSVLNMTTPIQEIIDHAASVLGLP